MEARIPNALRSTVALLTVLIVACLSAGTAHARGQADEWNYLPGFKKATWEKVKARAQEINGGTPADTVIDDPYRVGRNAGAQGETSCDKQSDGKYHISAYVGQMKKAFNVPGKDFSGMNASGVVDRMAAVIVHEMQHACLRGAGVPCPQGNVRLCEELAIDSGTIGILCDSITQCCAELCNLRSSASSPPTSDELAAIAAKKKEIADLCKAVKDRQDKYGQGGAGGHAFFEWICWCTANGHYASPNAACPSVVMPPQPPNPTTPPPADDCDYPDQPPFRNPMPDCPPCDQGCGCPPLPEETGPF
jgi:hypothetical protein